ncbi:EAL domain-containing protein [Gynuella sp.]|uniref:EAL domain-containing protein n=1 Tax=Gynuella sp. TaxID=2969146 RepID=UPI003D0B434F
MFDTSLDDETFFKDYQSTLWYQRMVDAQQLLKSRILLIVSGFFTFTPLFLLSLRTYFEAELPAWVYLGACAIIGVGALLLWSSGRFDVLARFLTLLFFLVIPMSYYLPGAYQVQFMFILCFPFLAAGLYNSFSAAIQTQLFFIWICICWLPHVSGVMETAYYSTSITLWMMILGTYVLLSLVGILSKRYNEEFFRSVIELVHYDQYSGLIKANDLANVQEWHQARWLVLVEVDHLSQILAIGDAATRMRIMQLLGERLNKKVPTFPFSAYQWSDNQVVLLLSETASQTERHLEVSLYRYIEQLNRYLNEAKSAGKYLLSVTAACVAIRGRSPNQVVADCQLAVRQAQEKQLLCVVLDETLKEESFDLNYRKKYRVLRANLEERKTIISTRTVFSARTGKVAWQECVLKIDNLEDGFAALDEYLGMAQKFGLYEQVSDHLLQHVEHYLSEHKTNLSVNLLLADLFNARIYKILFDLCQQAGAHDLTLILNVTLPADPFDVDRCQEIMRVLRQQGAKIALSGISDMDIRMGMLVTLPIDIVTLAHHLIKTMTTDIRKERLVKAVVSFCHANQQTVVADGIDTGTLKRAAEALGFNYLKGNLLATETLHENPRFIATHVRRQQ